MNSKSNVKTLKDEIKVLKDEIRKPKPKKKKSKSSSKSRNSGKDCFAALLNDPFSNPPCRLGWGTMVPTALGTCSYRGTVSCNTDGSYAILVNPTLGQGATGIANPIMTNVSGANGVTWTGTAFQNIAQYPSALLTETRIISVGLRVSPLVAQTSAPGVIYAGQINGITPTLLSGYSPTGLAIQSTLKTIISTNAPIRIVTRPIDNTAYEFGTATTYGGAGNLYDHSTIACALIGFPSSASLIIDVILHFEYMPNANLSNNREYNMDMSQDEPKISSFFSSAEAAWDYTSSRLNPSAIFDVSSAILNFATARNVNSMLQRPRYGRLQ